MVRVEKKKFNDRLNRRGKTKSINFKLIISFIIFFLLMFTSSVLADPTPGGNEIERIADPNTMDSYVQAMMGGYDSNSGHFVNKNGSRFAGEVWADKSVFAYGEKNKDFDGKVLKLDQETDGLNENIELDEDFLHTFSVLGSSRQIVGETPIDLVMVLDVSGSMGYAGSNESKINQSITAMNNAIEILMNLNKENRVAVVLFASRPAVLMPLAHYNSKLPHDDNALVGRDGYINITKSEVYDNTSAPEINDKWYTYTINAIQTNDQLNTIYSGTKNKNGGNGTFDGTWKYVGSNTNMDSGFWKGLNILADVEDTTVVINNESVSRIPAFIFLGDGDPQFMLNQKDGNWWSPVDEDSDFDLNTANFNNKTVILSTIMRAALMKEVVTKHYQRNADEKGISNFDQIQCEFYTIGIKLGQTGHNTGKAVATAILDPGNESLGFNSNNNKYYDGSGTNDGFGTNASGREQSKVANAYNYWKNWINESDNVTTSETDGYTSRIFNQFPNNEIEIKDVKIEKDSFKETIDYTDSFFNAETASSIGGILENLVKTIATPAFIPVNGINASGVDSSITYTDPIGAYMELKDITDMTLFGEHYSFEKIGVYDYKINEEILKNGNESSEFPGLIKEGWYRNSDNAYLENGNWETATYRLNFNSAEKHIPTLTKNQDEIKEKELNTTFTFYHITKKYDSSSNLSNMENMEVVNPCYKSGTVDSETTFNLNDIHVWLEDTGDYYDEYGHDNIPDAAYQQALYINIPAEAIPLQVATITTQSNNDVKEYETNLENYKESTPLRIFYEVGLDSKYINSNGDVVLATIPYSYLTNHTLIDEANQNRRVYFNSNYYSNSTYDDYPTVNRSYEQGNPSVTFSPGLDNSFYLFQQPRLLYWIKDENLTGSQDQRPNDIILANLDENTFTNLNCELVDNPKEQLDRDNWYYIIREYYSSIQGLKGTGKVNYIALARKGSEFGSGIAGDNIGRAEFLCWYNPNNGDTQKYDIDNEETRGKPGDGYYVAARVGGLRVGGMADTIGVKGEEIRQPYQENLVNNPTDTAVNYFLPTISTSSDEENIIVNLFLGNNGRLAVDNTKLLLTKTVNNVNGVLTEEQRNQKFDFTVEIENYVGKHQAIVVLRDEFDPSLWRRRFDSIDVLTSNENLLQNTDNSLAIVNSEGEHIGKIKENAVTKYYYFNENNEIDTQRPYEGKDLFYVYVGENIFDEFDTGGVNVFRAFQADENNIFGNKVCRGGRTFYVDPLVHELHEEGGKTYFKAADKNHRVGERDYWIDKVYKIPIDDVDNPKTGISWSWEYDEISSGIEEQIPYESLEQFVIASLYVTKELTSVTELTSDYAIRSNYMTQEVEFERDENNSCTAEVSLEDGEGLLFYSIHNNSNYSVYETLTENQIEDGIFVQEVNHITDKGSEIKYPQKNIQFKIDGKTSSYENRIHYINYMPNISKVEVSPGEDNLIKVEDAVNYNIVWENFAFDGLKTNKNKAEKVTVIDPLDRGVDFTRAVFDPDFGNIINSDYDSEKFIEEIDPKSETKYVDSNTENNLVLTNLGPDEPLNGYYKFNKKFIDNGQLKEKEITVNYNFRFEENIASGTYNYIDTNKDYVIFIVTIKYDPDTHTVSWDIENAPASTYGSVGLEVKVNENADKLWDYETEKLNNNEIDLVIHNRASIIVDNYPEVFTEIIDNPTEPTKIVSNIESDLEENVQNPEEPFSLPDEDNEVLDILPNSDVISSLSTRLLGNDVNELNDDPLAVNDGPSVDIQSQIKDHNGDSVFVGDKITYRINFRNYKKVKTSVTITDKLDPGVSLISAKYGNTVYNYSENSALSTEGTSEDMKTVISYIPSNHTVEWKIENYPASHSGFVEVTVKVLDEAIDKDESGEVNNQAIVYIGDDPEIETNETENPIGEPHKTELTPGDGEYVEIGDQITYQITYVNPTENVAKITIIDPLDIGVDYVSSNPVIDEGKVSFIDADNPLPEGINTDKINYDFDKFVKWTIENVPAHSEGQVTLGVKVNDKATTINEDEKIVKDRAFVQLNDEEFIPTEQPENPLYPDDDFPHKTEESPGDQSVVKVGDIIEYKISYANSSKVPKNVTIKDPIDVGLEFVEASKGGTYDPNDSIPENNAAKLGYSYKGVVTWNLGTVESGVNDFVTLKVKVLDVAKTKNIVRNKALVSFDNNPWIETEDPANPLGEPHKEEVTPGNGQNVTVGQEVTYEISYVNNSNEATTITIVDPLDRGVDYVRSNPEVKGNSAIAINSTSQLPEGIDLSKIDYTYDKYVIWSLNVGANQGGSIKLTVRVNENATTLNIIKDIAFVRNGSGPFYPTEEPTNPLTPSGNPHKTEKTPGNYMGVEVGDTITYNISYVNSTNTPQNITIKDPLDYGLTFVSATVGGTYSNTETLGTIGTTDYKYQGVVTWQLISVPAKHQGTVSLTVTVNNNALINNIVYNKAFVKVGNSSWTPTEQPENPLGKPHKVEKSPGNKKIVETNEEITYQINYVNNSNEYKTINIIDPLDSGLTFVSASNNGQYIATGRLPNNYNVSYTYNGIVTWSIANVAPRQSGFVTLTVKVNNSAISSKNKTVYNQAFVQVGNNPFQPTEEVENPLDEESFPDIKIEKEQETEDVTRTKEFFTTDQGKIITYYLTITNTSDKDATNIVVSDNIPQGLTYVDGSATEKGVYAFDCVTWTFEKLEAGKSIEVSFQVQIPEDVDENYYTNVATVDWDDNKEEPVESNLVTVNTPPEAVEEEDPEDSKPIDLPLDLPIDVPIDTGDKPINVTPENPSNSTTDPTKPSDSTQPTTDNLVQNSNNTQPTVTREVANTKNVTTTSTTTTESPKTGLNNMLSIWIGVIVICLIILGITFGVSYYKKGKKE